MREKKYIKFLENWVIYIHEFYGIFGVNILFVS